MAIFIDFSKCFDSLSHRILLTKLKYLGFNHLAMNWFTSYLRGRKQFVDFNGSKSKFQKINWGIPQGTVMGPLLFLIYTSEIVNIVKHCTPAIFADDTSLLVRDKTFRGLFEKASYELKLFQQWFDDNMLTANMSKTKYMLFDSASPNLYKLQIGETTLEEVQKFKLVGVVINNSLSWIDHYDHILTKIRPCLRALYLVRNSLDTDCKLLIYNSLIISHLNYCLPIWSNLTSKQTTAIQVIMNKALRSIFNIKKRDSCSLIYKQNKLLQFKENTTYMKLTYIKSLCLKTTPNNIRSLIEFERNTTYQTRNQSDKLRLQETLFKKQSLKNQSLNDAIERWNKLNPQIKNLPMNKFKKTLKFLLLTETT